MLGGYLHYGLVVALAIALLVAAATDWRRRQIDNWLNLGIALVAPLYWIAKGLPLWAPLWQPSVVLQIGVGIAAFAVFAAFFALKWMGGGDVKLLTALALWIDPEWFLRLLMVMGVVGGVLTLVLGAWHVTRRQRDKLAVPYGVAIAIAGLWVLGVHYLPAAQLTLVG
jgi:prepilin peptidase CpaA